MRTPARLSLALVVMISPAIAQSSAPASTDELPTLNHFDPNVVDRNLDPCVDFYKFVCSKWQSANPILPDQASWDTGSTLDLWNDGMLRNTMAQAANPAPSRSAVEQKIGDYWYSCMNEAAIEKSGLAPLQPELDSIRALRDKAQIAGVLAEIHMKMPDSWGGGNNETVSPMLGFSSTIDYNNAKLVVAGVDQGGFAMNGRDFYLSDNPHLAEVRGKYADHVQRVFVLAGESNAKAKADAATVVRIETARAKAAMDSVKRRDPRNINNVMSLRQVLTLTPSFRWNDYLAAVRAPTPALHCVCAGLFPCTRDAAPKRVAR